jgi:hypothetical protein
MILMPDKEAGEEAFIDKLDGFFRHPAIPSLQLIIVFQHPAGYADFITASVHMWQPERAAPLIF